MGSNALIVRETMHDASESTARPVKAMITFSSAPSHKYALRPDHNSNCERSRPIRPHETIRSRAETSCWCRNWERDVVGLRLSKSQGTFDSACSQSDAFNTQDLNTPFRDMRGEICRPTFWKHAATFLFCLSAQLRNRIDSIGHSSNRLATDARQGDGQGSRSIFDLAPENARPSPKSRPGTRPLSSLSSIHVSFKRSTREILSWMSM